MNRFNLNKLIKKNNIYESPELCSNNKEKHIMFSYSWSQQDKVKSIYNKVKQELYYSKLWIDFEKMKGNILQTMNDAIENSYLILVFLSSNYKKSKNCKIESELIIGKQKKFILIKLEKNYPYTSQNELEEDNWLAKLYKDQFYIDLSEMNLDNLNRLIKDIQSDTIEYYRKNKIYKENLPITLYDINSINENEEFNLNNYDENLTNRTFINNSFKKKERNLSISSSSSIISSQTISTNTYTIEGLIETNEIDDNDKEKLKELLKITPRTTTSVLQASGISIKSIIALLEEAKFDP
jgi:hypothetical protein